MRRNKQTKGRDRNAGKIRQNFIFNHITVSSYANDKLHDPRRQLSARCVIIHIWAVIGQCLHLNQQLNEDAQSKNYRSYNRREKLTENFIFNVSRVGWCHEADASSLDFSRGSAELWKCKKKKKKKRGGKKKPAVCGDVCVFSSLL